MRKAILFILFALLSTIILGCSDQNLRVSFIVSEDEFYSKFTTTLINDPGMPIVEGYEFVGWTTLNSWAIDDPMFHQFPLSFPLTIPSSDSLQPFIRNNGIEIVAIMRSWHCGILFELTPAGAVVVRDQGIADDLHWGLDNIPRNEIIIPQFYDGVRVIGIASNASIGQTRSQLDGPVNIVLSHGLLFIGDNSMSSRVIFNLPDTLEHLGVGNFTSPHINSIIIPDSILEIGDYTFYRSNIKEVILGRNVRQIGTSAFAFSSLEKIEFPNSLIRIGENAFRHTNISEVAIPHSVSYIGMGAFARANISSLTLSNGIVEIGMQAFQSNNIETLALPSSLRIIGVAAFSDNSQLNSVVFAHGLEYIGRSAFEGTALSTINIPFSVQFIGIRAFQSTNITRVVVPQNTHLEIEEFTVAVDGGVWRVRRTVFAPSVVITRN